jgi:hypothetical protein
MFYIVDHMGQQIESPIATREEADENAERIRAASGRGFHAATVLDEEQMDRLEASQDV